MTFQRAMPDKRLAQRLLTSGSPTSGVERMAVLQSWTRFEPAAAPDLRSWMQLGGSAAEISAETRNAVRDAFLSIVDDELQAMYQSRHWGSLSPDQLAAGATEAQAIVARYDWGWLARWLFPARPDGVADCLRRLSNFAFAVDRVNFRFSYHCNISCAHCYNSSGPAAKALRIEADAMCELVGQMPRVGISALNLTGGEPFLYREALTTVIGAAREAGLDAVSIYTNAFWARSDADTDAVLDQLERAGFMEGGGDHLKASAGVFHQEFLDFKHVVTLARRYFERYGKKLIIDFEVSPALPAALESARAMLADAGLDTRVTLYVRGTAPLGRGRNLDGVARSRVTTPCHSIDQIVIDPDGKVRPCCGLNNENEGVVIGQMGRSNLAELIKRMQNDPLLQLMANQPMETLFDVVPDARNSPSGFAGKCHLCQEAVGHLAERSALNATLSSRQRWYPFWFERMEGGTVTARTELA